MDLRRGTVLKYAGAGALAAGALALAVLGFRGLGTSGEEGAAVWFYDQSEKRLYAAPRDAIPPHEGIGGTRGDGVRAVVVAPSAERNDPAKRRIAYLETYGPELKAVLERVREARAARRAYDGPIPSRDSDFFQNHTLVKRPDDAQWQPVSSREGQRIMAEWRSWPAPGEPPLVVCVP